MTETKIATLINTVLVPNLLGEETTIAEDLSNIVDVGTALEDLDANSLKDYNQMFGVGVIKDWFNTRKYDRETYGLFIDEIEYGGAVQKTRARLLKAYNTPILSLENYNADSSAPDYNDGHYYGTEFDTKLYTKTSSFMIPYSVPVEMFKKAFMSADGVRKLVAMIESNADNTLTVELNSLAKSVLRRLALSCNSARKINLLSTYNTEFGFESGDDGYVTLASWKNDTNFKLWCEEVVIRLKKAITNYNAKYNDGTIETFTPEDDTRVTLLTEFATALDFAQSSVYHRELTDIGSYSTIEFWQNNGTDLIPTINSTSVHDEIVETVGEDEVTISHLVGIVYDRLSGGITNRLTKTTSDYIAKGDFNTFFHHVAKDHWIDTRDSAIILCLA